MYARKYAHYTDTVFLVLSYAQGGLPRVFAERVTGVRSFRTSTVVEPASSRIGAGALLLITHVIDLDNYNVECLE